MTRAFSIVELVIAIALLGLVAALALPAGVALLTNEGRRSGLFACESALRTVRDHAMRDAMIIEIGALEQDGAWTLVTRPLGTAQSDVGADDSDDERAWDVIATLPDGFAFRFEPMPTAIESLDALPEPPAALGPQPLEPERVALVLPSGAVEANEAWRLVTDTDGAPRVDLLRVGRWTGHIEPERDVAADGFAPPEAGLIEEEPNE